MSLSIGDPLPRVDGRAKVTGSAKYSAEFTSRVWFTLPWS